MADAVTSQTLVDNPKTAIFKFTNISDGSGESAVKKIDVSALSEVQMAVHVPELLQKKFGGSVMV